MTTNNVLLGFVDGGTGGILTSDMTYVSAALSISINGW